MNHKNYEFLRDQVKYTGFGDALDETLKERMQMNPPQIHIVHEAKIGNESLFTTLHFKKSEQTDMYFFNKYNLEIKPENSQEKMMQTFYINKGNNITLKEAYNLMNGRAVNKDLTNKEGQQYNAWVQLDMKQTDASGNCKMNFYHQNYGYDLKSSLAMHPIKELTNEQDKASLIQSLQKGNRQSVTFSDGDKNQKMFVEANPQYKTINVYDASMKKVEKESLMQGKAVDGNGSRDIASDSKKLAGQLFRKDNSQKAGKNEMGFDHKPRKKGHSL